MMMKKILLVGLIVAMAVNSAKATDVITISSDASRIWVTLDQPQNPFDQFTAQPRQVYQGVFDLQTLNPIVVRDVTAGKDITTFQYDSQNRLIEMFFPDTQFKLRYSYLGSSLEKTEVWSYGSKVGEETYAYSSYGNYQIIDNTPTTVLDDWFGYLVPVTTTIPPNYLYQRVITYTSPAQGMTRVSKIIDVENSVLRSTTDYTYAPNGDLLSALIRDGSGTAMWSENYYYHNCGTYNTVDYATRSPGNDILTYQYDAQPCDPWSSIVGVTDQNNMPQVEWDYTYQDSTI